MSSRPAAFNLGIAIGAWAGGEVVASSLGLGATPGGGAMFVADGLILTLVSGGLDRRQKATVEAAVATR